MLFLDVRPRWLIENTFAPPHFSNDVATILEESFKGLGACLFLWTFIVCREQYRRHRCDEGAASAEASA
jgi:hypothetical protein